MTIEFTTAYTKTPVVEFSWPVEGIQPLFDDYQTWENESDFKGGSYTGMSKRLFKKAEQVRGTPAWDNLEYAMSSSKNQLVEKMLEIDKEFRWPNMPIQISNQLCVYARLVSDLAGHDMNPHIDNRSVYAAGYLNVFDNKPVTVVSTNKLPIFNLSRYRAPGKKGHGAIWLNTNNSWHWVNKASKDRRIVLFTFHLVPWN